jgi:hypothetical protein
MPLLTADFDHIRCSDASIFGFSLFSDRPRDCRRQCVPLCVYRLRSFDNVVATVWYRAADSRSGVAVGRDLWRRIID